jgi:hypothetical protein
MNELRIGTAERERAAAQLGEHFAAGRLEPAEFDERVAQVYAARTEADLAPVFADLPSLHPAAAPRPTPPAAGWGPRRTGFGVARRALLPALLVVLFLALTIGSLASAHHAPPPFFLFVLVWFAFGRRRAWRHR